MGGLSLEPSSGKLCLFLGNRLESVGLVIVSSPPAATFLLWLACMHGTAPAPARTKRTFPASSAGGNASMSTTFSPHRRLEAAAPVELVTAGGAGARRYAAWYSVTTQAPPRPMLCCKANRAPST